MENNKLLIITIFFLLFQSIVNAQNGASIPDKYYCLKNYYDATNCNKISEYILDKKENNKFIAVFNVKDSLIETYEETVFNEFKDSLLNNSYQVSRLYYSQDEIYFNYLDKNHRLVCEERYSDKNGNDLKLVQKRDSKGAKIYEEINLKKGQKTKCWFPNNQLEACIQRKLTYEDDRLAVKKLHGWQKIWYVNGNLKCKMLCKHSNVVRLFLYSENGKLNSLKKFSKTDKVKINEALVSDKNKAYFYLDGSCEVDCPFY